MQLRRCGRGRGVHRHGREGLHERAHHGSARRVTLRRRAWGLPCRDWARLWPTSTPTACSTCASWNLRSRCSTAWLRSPPTRRPCVCARWRARRAGGTCCPSFAKWRAPRWRSPWQVVPRLPRFLPSEAWAVCNIRIEPGRTVEETFAELKRRCEPYDVELEMLLSNDPSPVSDSANDDFARVERAVNVAYPDVPVMPFLLSGWHRHQALHGAVPFVLAFHRASYRSAADRLHARGGRERGFGDVAARGRFLPRGSARRRREAIGGCHDAGN